MLSLTSAILVILHYSQAQDILREVHGSNFFCPSDLASYECVSQSSLDWTIRIPQGNTFLTSFSNSYNSVGEFRVGNLASTTVTARVTFINSSFVGSLITLSNAIPLNGTSITCNEETATLVVEEIAIHHLPSVMVLTQFGLSFNFVASWTVLVPTDFIKSYNITVVPSQQIGISNIFTNNPSVILRLDWQSLYNITIYTSFCNGLILSKNFIAGKCPFLLERSILMEYYIFANDSVFLQILCFNNVNVTINCNESGKWENISICNNDDDNNEITDSVIKTLETPSQNEPILIQRQCDASSLPVVAGLSSGLVVMGLIFSLLTFLLGLFCKGRIMINKKRSISNTPSQIYEEIATTTTSKKFETTSNAAYGQVQKV